ncbi:MAG TPA: glucokinase [Myxococcales bacterium]|jgi:glucokinase|nr:glucokinase [Myxococcales bacterium]
MQVLAGDIGGTKTLLAVCEVGLATEPSGAPSIDVLASNRYDSRKYPGLGAICRAFASEMARPMPQYAGFGVAGPVANGRSHTTNLPWILDERDLAALLGIRSVRLANDFHTLALGIPAVKPADLVTLNEGVRDPKGPWAVIGAGTGLGEAIATLDASGHRQVLATEGGHTSFSPRTELEIGVLRFLSQRYDHVSWERIVSGEGLVNLAEAISHITGLRLTEPLSELIKHDRLNAPAAVTACAEAGDPLCKHTLELFVKLYGAEAGNLALKTLATGGVYVAGGIAPKILPAMTDGRFRDGFFDKGRMRALLELMPVQVVLDTRAGLLGAAALAAREASLAPQTRHIATSSQ